MPFVGVDNKALRSEMGLQKEPMSLNASCGRIILEFFTLAVYSPAA